MTHTKFRGSQSTGSGKNFFKNFTIYGRGSHLGHATSIRLIHFSLYLKGYIPNSVKNGPVVSEKSKSEFSYVNDLGPRSRNDLDLEYSHTLFNPISCLHLPTYRSQAAKSF